MLGRTNVVQRRRPTINGDVANFTVANGNTISVGDFVQYKLASNLKTFDSRAFTFTFCLPYDEATKKVICCFNKSYLFLLKVNGDDVEILDSITITQDASSVPTYDAYSKKVYYVKTQTVSSTTLTFTVGTVKIQNDEFVEESDISGSITNTNVRHKTGSVVVRNGRVFLTDYYINSSQGVRQHYVWAIKEQSGSYVYDQTWIVSTYGSGTNAPTFSMWLKDENDIIVVCYVTSGSYYPSVVIPLKYNVSDDSYSLGTSITESNASSPISQVVFNDDYFVFSLQKSVGFRVYKVVNGELVLVANKGYGNYSSVSCLLFYGFDNQFVSIGGYYSGVYFYSIHAIKIDENENIFEVGKTQQVSTTSDEYYTLFSGAIFVVSDGNGVLFVGGSVSSQTKYTKAVLDYENEQVFLGTFGGEVEAYNGGITVGFAKTGGVAGDIIQVYTPHQSS